MQEHIKEMTALCGELFTSDIWEDFGIMAMTVLASATGQCDGGNKPCLDQCITSVWEVSLCQPNSCMLSILLAYSLMLHFDETLSNDEFEEATIILNKIHGPESPCTGNSLDT